MSRILVAMSGGVDSSVAAALLHEQGHEVVGVWMRLHDVADSVLRVQEELLLRWTPPRTPGASRPARHPVLRHEPRARVRRRACIEPFLGAYLDGRTPSPCVDCNTT